MGKQNFRTSLVTVTPAMAAEWLAQGENRAVRRGTVEKYARAMERGEWRPGQPIMLDEKGYCLDGQHRLLAVIKFGQPVDFVVITDFDRVRTYTVLDEGAPRFLYDKIKSDNPKLYAAAARYSWVLDENQPGGAWQTDLGTNLGGISHSLLVDYYDQIRDELEMANTMLPEMQGKLLSRSFMVALNVHFRRRDPQLAEHFMTALATGQNLGGSSLILYLRERIIEQRALTVARTQGTRFQGTRTVIAWIIKSWNMLRDNPEVENDGWGRTRRLIFTSKEPFPKIK